MDVRRLVCTGPRAAWGFLCGRYTYTYACTCTRTRTYTHAAAAAPAYTANPTNSTPGSTYLTAYGRSLYNVVHYLEVVCLSCAAVLYVPCTLAVVRLYHCQDGLLSVEPAVQCGSSSHVWSALILSLMVAPLVVGNPNPNPNPNPCTSPTYGLSPSWSTSTLI